MGRFRANAIKIRQFTDIEIVFKDCETIWLISGNGNIIFHRWWSPRGSYTAGWQDFRRKLWRYKNLTTTECLRLAVQHDIQFMATFRKPTLVGEIEIIKED